MLGGLKKVSSHHWERNKPSQILMLLLLLHLKLLLQWLHANTQQENINLVIRTARTSPFIFGGHNYKIVKKEREKNKTLGLSNCTACIFFFPRLKFDRATQNKNSLPTLKIIYSFLFNFFTFANRQFPFFTEQFIEQYKSSIANP